ncbi:MAG: hypothetical protein HY043_24110 [Verrucomicrobia bacterium]|nr:hypothetical protein [Verrucomicrobiota bacterium]
MNTACFISSFPVPIGFSRANWCRRVCALLAMLVVFNFAPSHQLLAASAQVTLVRVPNGGIQPQAVVDEAGATHLIYFKGEPGAGDLYYVRQDPGKAAFSQSIRVNSAPGSAIAVGTIRGGQLAIGRNRRVHVAWNGSQNAKSHEGAPMLYARLNDTGSAFEPQRDVITFTSWLDGGGSVAADEAGNVYVMWHAFKPGNTEGEAGRAVFVARSVDDGKTFAKETLATSVPTGACGCCGLKAFADRQGNLLALFRAASDKTNRAETILISRNRGTDFEIAYAHPWNIATCVMSSASFAATSRRTLGAWETEGQVYFAGVDAKTLKVSSPVAPPGTGQRKHPVAVENAKGETLLAWTEGTGWQRGGAVAWQVFDASDKPSAEKGRADGVPVWGLVAAVAKPDGSFVVFY